MSRTNPCSAPRLAWSIGLTPACLYLLAAPTCLAQREHDGQSLADAVTRHYVTMAHARYEDSYAAAEELVRVVKNFLAEPTEASHRAAKAAWIEAHSLYSHTEVFRFGNPNVDAWEGRVNAWPMDEGLLDYVADGYVFHEGNPNARDDLIGKGVIPITDGLIEELQSGADPKEAPTTTISDIETNVTRGYHAVEFLLWGQDLNRPAASCGRRPYTDFSLGEDCTHGRCDRRRDYLSAAARLILRDLRMMLIDWRADGALYSQVFLDLPVEERLDRMIVGMGTMSFGELASERMQVALLTSDQEEEQSCFSDTTHVAIRHNARGIETLYRGTHERYDGSTLRGPSLSDLVRKLDPELDRRLAEQFAVTAVRAGELAAAAEAGEPFDQMILASNEAGRARIQALIDALASQTESLETIRGVIDRLAQL